ncbi:carboxypeptidase regulatory-like domain-containing protein [Nocardioides sp. YIM 152315]|uniref:carboxypeptidase regulatory-like domain-containing protein n=1 Tax=Nocardioides sp. YIM 152315 TaxID=3031760 RepID=UPI0023DBEFAA|nr:carboxypeptidase regulatory-like domain-containing protein [Nocardioides sp. YIM 152315]MDF1603296.1 carboxypeptidase regulatory-like domain-containing protein [Nocardioides sp. YIM 152315]
MSQASRGPEPAPGLTVSPGLRTAAGSPLPVEVTVTNTAAAPRVLAVGAIGVDGGWLPPLTRTEPLAPGQSALLTVLLSPPIGTVPGQYPFAFTAQALDPDTGRPSGAPATMLDSSLVVNPRNQLTLELDPRTVSMIASRRVRLTLRNSGDSTARVRLETRASPRLGVRLRAQDLAVEPGATRVVKGRVSVSRGRLFGGVEHHTYTVSARGTETVRHVEGSVTQRPAIGLGWLKLVALLAVLSIWIAAAVVFIPRLADRIGSPEQDTTAVNKPDKPADEQEGAGDQGDGDGGDGGSGGDAGGGDSGDGGGGGSGTTAAPAGAEDDGDISLSGTVAGDRPGGVVVSLSPTSLVEEAAQEGGGVGVPSSELGSTGMSLASSFLNQALPETPPDRTARTTGDGSWAFTDVPALGYYLLTFRKPGFQTRSFVIDASSEAAGEPLEVEMAAGEGRMSGTVRGPRGAVGAATVTITDGTTTMTTSTNSKGGVGHWSVRGLSTPGTYVVSASLPGLSSESELVELAAGGSAVADLELRHGVGTLAGKVRATNQQGKLAGAGGVQVTVTGADGKVRTATTLTRGEKPEEGSSARVSAGLVGTYKVPGLTVPGTYVVTFSGAGLQPYTSEVTFKRGQPAASIDTDLVSSTGSIAGKISGADGKGIVGAGLTLVGGDNTYKTMSTSDPEGSYLLNGITPGTYTLGIQYFGFLTDYVTVKVRAGHTTPLNRAIQELKNGVLAGRAKIQGRVVDATTGTAVSCAGSADNCVVASTVESAVVTDDDDNDPGTTYSTKFLPGDMFTLPDDTRGLLPGLHTVRVAAPHYESATTRVQVPSEGTVNVGTLGLYPAPKIVGTITTVIGVPSGPTCVWAVPAGQPAPDTPCATAANTTCQHTTATFDLASTGPEPVCAFVNGRGDYSLELFEHGSYTVYVQPSDPEYLQAGANTLVLGVGDTKSYSVQIHRLGRITVTTKEPGTSGSLVPAADVAVEVSPDPGTTWPLTNGAGQTTITGLTDRTYTFSASHGDRSDQRTQRVGLDQELTLDLILTHPIGNVVGQVTANIDGAPLDIDDAAVKVTAPADYSGGSTVLGTASMTTDADGCFAIQPAPEDITGTPTTPAAGDCDGPWTSASLSRTTFLSDAASSIEITRDGYERLLVTNRQLASPGLNSFSMDPVPIDGNQLVVHTDPAASAIAWGSVRFTVAITGGGNQVSVTATQVGEPEAGTAVLTWSDTRLPVGRARPGTYTITASADGYQTASQGVVCAVGAAACVWDDEPLTLVKQGGLTISAVDSVGPVNGAEFTLIKDGTTIRSQTASAGTNSVTFLGLEPYATDYQVRIRAAGHEFGLAGDGGDLPTTCGTTYTIPAGDTIACAATLTRLATISGTVRGIGAKPPATAPFRGLASAQVTITRCTDTTTVPGYCSDVDEDERFVGTADANGVFAVTGTASDAGLRNGDWLVEAAAPGFHATTNPGGALPGVLVAGLAGDRSVAISLYVDLVTVNVNLTDQSNRAVSDASVRLLTPNGITEVAVATDPEDDGIYTLANIVPTSYLISVAKDGYIGGTTEVTFAEGVSPTTRYVSIVRGASAIDGIVGGDDVTGGVNGVRVRVCADETCSAGPVDGTDAAALVGTTPMTAGTAGSFGFATVPNGTFWLVLDKHGYDTQAIGPLQFRYDQAGFRGQAPTLVAVTRDVSITLLPNAADNDLTGATVTLTGGDGTVHTVTPLAEDDDGGYVASFLDVRRGCWTVGVTLPTGHHGDVGALEDVAPTDDEITCAADRLVVSGDEADDTGTTASVDVDEAKLTFAVAATTKFGHVAPSFDVTVSRAGVASPYFHSASFAVGSAEMWVPTGIGYQVDVTRVPADPFWPATGSGPFPVTVAGVSQTVTMNEQAATLAITVTGASATSVATLLIEPLAGNTEALPADAPTSTTGTTAAFELPAGGWQVTATLEGETDVKTVTVDDPHAYTLALEPPPPDPPDEPADPEAGG